MYANSTTDFTTPRMEGPVCQDRSIITRYLDKLRFVCRDICKFWEAQNDSTRLLKRFLYHAYSQIDQTLRKCIKYAKKDLTRANHTRVKLTAKLMAFPVTSKELGRASTFSRNNLINH